MALVEETAGSRGRDCLREAGRSFPASMLRARSSAWQRGSSPLGILCICGESGVGKSTLAVALSRQGHAILADDDIVICNEAGTQRLSPNYPGSRLTEESAKLLGLKDGDSLPSFQAPTNGSGRHRTGHRLLPSGTHAIWGFVILEVGHSSPASFERVKDTAAFEILWSQIKYPWMSLPGWRARQFRVIANLAQPFRSFPLEKNPEEASPSVAATDLLDLISAGRG